MQGIDFFTRLATDAAMGSLAPGMLTYFRNYLEHEKAVEFGDHYVINTHLPPWPSQAFDAMISQFLPGASRRLFAVTWALTNRCDYRCWHCYNEGRSQCDLSLDQAKLLAQELNNQGAVMVTLTGGEPLLRDDLEEIVEVFSDETTLTLGTTGDGLTPARARALKQRGVFSVGISVDTLDERRHDSLRGRKGAFQIALDALKIAGDAGLYPYIVSLGTREFLQREPFYAFMDFAKQAGAREVHVLEPSATGKLDGRSDVLLTANERKQLLTYQQEIAKREDLPVLSTLAYLESGSCFGCGAGQTYLYIDGSGEVCPCNLVPMSFGNVQSEPLPAILDRMADVFQKPRTCCVGKQLAGNYPDGVLPTPLTISKELCRTHLPVDHDLPEFVKIREGAHAEVGSKELRQAYDSVHSDYENYWLSQAAVPVDELISRLDLSGTQRLFEVGCGTGYGTAALARRMPTSANLQAVDLSEGMLSEARRQLHGIERVCFQHGDALGELRDTRKLDLVFSSWVLGYIPLAPFFKTVADALSEQGQLAFVVHRQNSPALELQIFRELVAEDPAILTKRVDFEFPHDITQVKQGLAEVNMQCEWGEHGEIVFTYDSATGVLEHLLKSGAGTAFYDAIEPKRRRAVEQEFITRRKKANGNSKEFRVVHNYLTCIASRA